MNCSLRYGLDLYRNYFFETHQTFLTAIPFINSLTVHPLIFLVLKDIKAMSWEIRLGYCLIEIFLILFDWIFNFALRPYSVGPYAGLFCGGLRLRQLRASRKAIMISLSTAITAHVPCVWFIFMQIHKHVTAGNGNNSILRLSNRQQSFMVCISIILTVAKIWGSAMFGKDSDEAKRMIEEPELRWLADREGQMLAFGRFGGAQYFRFEMYILSLSMFLISLLPLIQTLDIIRRLAFVKSVKESNKTQAMKRQLLIYFMLLSAGGFICLVVPLSMFVSAMIFDLSVLPPPILITLRVTEMALFTLNPLQFAFICIVRNAGLLKIRYRRMHLVVFGRSVVESIGQWELR